MATHKTKKVLVFTIRYEVDPEDLNTDWLEQLRQYGAAEIVDVEVLLAEGK